MPGVNIIKQSHKNIDIVRGDSRARYEVQLIEKGEMDLGMITAWHGVSFCGNRWAKEHAPIIILSMFLPHSSYLFIFALKGSASMAIYDLAEKHVSVSNAGSTSFDAARHFSTFWASQPSNVSALPSVHKLTP